MNKPVVRLSCRHHVRVSFDRQNDRQAYCRFHGWQNVATVFHTEVHMFCADCRMSRWYGQGWSRGKAAAERHETNHPHHRTFVVWDQITRDGRGTERDKLFAQLATQAKLWDDEQVASTDDVTDIIPF